MKATSMVRRIVFGLVIGAALPAGLAARLGAEPPIVSEAPPPPPPPPSSAAPLDRARANYEAILRGEKTYFALSPAEQQEVAELDRRIRAQRPPEDSDPHERCREAEYAKLGRAPSALDARVIATRCR